AADELGSLTKRLSLGGRRWWRPPTRLRAVPPTLAPLLRRPTVEDDRDRPLVGQVEPHSRAEDARLDRDPESPERRGEVLVDRLGDVGLGGFAEARTVALLRVGDQRELAD